MAEEKAIRTEEKELEIHLETWNTYNNQICDVLEAIDQLTDQKHPYAVSLLAAELIPITEARQEALEYLKKYGIKNHEDVLFAVCKQRETKKKNETA